MKEMTFSLLGCQLFYDNKLVDTLPENRQFTSEGQYCIITSKDYKTDREARIYDRSGLLYSFTGSNYHCHRHVFRFLTLDDSVYLVAVTAHGLLTTYNLTTREVKNVPQHDDIFYGCIYSSPDQKYIIIPCTVWGASYETMYIWDYRDFLTNGTVSQLHIISDNLAYKITDGIMHGLVSCLPNKRLYDWDTIQKHDMETINTFEDSYHEMLDGIRAGTTQSFDSVDGKIVHHVIKHLLDQSLKEDVIVKNPNFALFQTFKNPVILCETYDTPLNSYYDTSLADIILHRVIERFFRTGESTLTITNKVHVYDHAPDLEEYLENKDILTITFKYECTVDEILSQATDLMELYKRSRNSYDQVTPDPTESEIITLTEKYGDHFGFPTIQSAPKRPQVRFSDIFKAHVSNETLTVIVE